MSKRSNNQAESNYPLVNVQRFQLLKCDVNTRQLEELTKYIAYVEEANGDKPTEGEVVGAALAELFKLDRGFQRWKERSQKPDASSHRGTEPAPRHAPQVG
jgi:hypothetical protein